MNVGAVLVLTADDGFRVERARQLLGERVCAVPRMRQRLQQAPPGCGRPYWADDPAFNIWHHVRQVAAPTGPCLSFHEDRLRLGRDEGPSGGPSWCTP